MKPRFAHLPGPVAARIGEYYRRRRLNGFLRGVVLSALLFLFLVLAVVTADRVFFMEEPVRVALTWAAYGITGSFALAYFGWFLWRRPSLRQVVYEMESRLSPEVEERYVTLESVMAAGAERTPVAQHLVERLRQSSIEHAETRLFPGLLARDPALRRLWMILGSLLILLLCIPASFQFPLMLRRFFEPGAPLPKPGFVKITVSPDGIVVGKGGEAIIQARIKDETPVVLRWLLKRAGHTPDRCVVSQQAGVEAFSFDNGRRSEMSRIDRDQFLFSASDLEGSFGFIVRCGDAETQRHIVRVVAQPRIFDATLVVTPPAFANRLGSQSGDWRSGPLLVLPGSRVKLAFRSDQPLASRKIQFENAKAPVEPDWDAKALRGSFEFTAREKTSFELTVVNREGFANRERLRVAIDLREAVPPVVRLDEPAGDPDEVAGALAPFRAEATDEFGVTEAAIRYSLNPDAASESAPREIPLPLPEGNPLHATLDSAFDLGATNAVPGDTISVQVRVRDTAGNDGFSRAVTVRVEPFTRDENERVRLQRLRFLVASLEPADRSKTPSTDTVLRLLEMEHHFTDAQRHKDDLRKLYVVLLRACDPSNSAAGRAATFQEMAEKLKALTGFREAKNITWRLFGMRTEAARIGDQIQKEAEGNSDATERRAKLYLDALQDIGGELIALAAKSGAMDKAGIGQRVGDLNTAAYRLRRGTPARRQEICLEIQGRITALLEQIRPSLAPLFQQELDARAQLDVLYRQSREIEAAGDRRLMELEPFLPLFPRMENLAPAAGSEDKSIIVAQERLSAGRMAFQWENESLLAMRDVSNSEKALQLTLSQIEESAMNSGFSTKQFEEVAALDLSKELSDADFRKLALPDTGVMTPPPLDPAALAQVAARYLRISPPAESLESVARDPVGDVESLNRLKTTLELRSSLFPLDAGDGADFILLRVREALGRYHVAVEQTADPLLSRKAMLQSLNDAAAAVRQGGERLAKMSAGYPLLTEFAATREGVKAASLLREGNAPPRLAEDFMARFSDAGVSYLAANEPRAESAVQAVTEAEQALRKAPVDFQEFAANAARARELLAGLGQAAARAGKGDLQTQLTRATARASEELRQLQGGGATLDALSVNRALLALGGIRSEVQGLVAQLASARERIRQNAPELSGGPDGIWQEEYRAGAARSRERLARQVETARRHLTASVLESMAENPDPRICRDGFGWALFIYRVMRSDLCGAGGVKTVASAKAPEANPQLRFLREELEKARKVRNLKNYAAPTKEYLDSVGDFLRY